MLGPFATASRRTPMSTTTTTTTTTTITTRDRGDRYVWPHRMGPINLETIVALEYKRANGTIDKFRQNVISRRC